MNTSLSTGCVAGSSSRETPGMSPIRELFQGTITRDLGESSFPRIDMPDIFTSPAGLAGSVLGGLSVFAEWSGLIALSDFAGVAACVAVARFVGTALPGASARRVLSALTASSAAAAPQTSNKVRHNAIERYMMPPSSASFARGRPQATSRPACHPAGPVGTPRSCPVRTEDQPDTG